MVFFFVFLGLGVGVGAVAIYLYNRSGVNYKGDQTLSPFERWMQVSLEELQRIFLEWFRQL